MYLLLLKDFEIQFCSYSMRFCICMCLCVCVGNHLLSWQQLLQFMSSENIRVANAQSMRGVVVTEAVRDYEFILILLLCFATRCSLFDLLVVFIFFFSHFLGQSCPFVCLFIEKPFEKWHNSFDR